MKKMLVLAIIAILIGLSLVITFAAEKKEPTDKPQTQQNIWLKSDTIQKIISAENDKSQPADSLTQRYRLLIETTSGQKINVTIEIKVNEKGKIIKAKNLNTSKQAGSDIQVHNFEVECTSPCKRVCSHAIFVFRQGGRNIVVDFYFCWCCCRTTC